MVALLFTAIIIIIIKEKESRKKERTCLPLFPFKPKAPPKRSGGSSFRFANLSYHLVQSMQTMPSTLIFLAFLPSPQNWEPITRSSAEEPSEVSIIYALEPAAHP
uniref:Uncharacterized protein n=1 Tax=Rhipicephalus appendiculatus TaxID=34631 RepID=A0A131YCM6_RHIAP